MNALIGYNGFVGSNILKQKDFDFCYNSKNIEEIKGMSFDLVVCSGVSSIKWKANKFPEDDYFQIIKLIKHLSKIKFKKMVLISTIAVYEEPVENAYGRNRLYLENYLRNNYSNVTIIRLPSLFGDGLRKNPIYDLMINNSEHLPNVESIFQYYDLNCIWNDIIIALDNNLKIVNFGTEPIKFSKVLDLFSFDSLNIPNDRPIINENMKTMYANYWGKSGDYLYSKEDVLNKLNYFIKSNK